MPGKNSFKKYRIAPLVGTGAIILVVLVLLALLIWALAAFAGQRDPAQQGTLQEGCRDCAAVGNNLPLC